MSEDEGVNGFWVGVFGGALGTLIIVIVVMVGIIIPVVSEAAARRALFNERCSKAGGTVFENGAGGYSDLHCSLEEVDVMEEK